MRSKILELDAAYEKAEFAPAKSFFLSKEDITNSEVFKFIREMPKGAALHTHHISLGPIPWVIANLTYRDNLYMRLNAEKDSLRFGWFPSPPTHSIDGMEWKSVPEARLHFGAEPFDEFIKQHLTCGLGASSNINDLWADFKRGKYDLLNFIFFSQKEKRQRKFNFFNYKYNRFERQQYH
jgi:hypothetical protein